MYYYGGGSQCGCGNNYSPCYQPSCGSSNYAIILVLFILLVIVIGARQGR